MSAIPLSDIAYQHIQRRLLENSLSPGMRISEARLAAELKISRTPVREAIRRLSNEGVLHQIPSSGTFVRQPHRSQVIEAYEVREALECFAIRKAVRKMTPKQRTELTLFSEKMHAAVISFRDSGSELMDGDVLNRFLTADLGFHLTILRAAENHSVLKIIGDMHMRNRSFGFRTHFRDLHHVAWVWLIHARIAKAVRKHDAKQAVRLMRRHIRESLKDALAAFDKQLAMQTTQGEATGLAEAMDELVSLLTGEQHVIKDNPRSASAAESTQPPRLRSSAS